MGHEKIAEVILDSINVTPEQYRLGRSKVQDSFATAIRCLEAFFPSQQENFNYFL